MSIQRIVFSKLFKEELASYKVELALIDDIKNAVEQGKRIEKDLASNLNSYNGLLRAGNIVKKSMTELMTKAKELGVDIPAELKSFDGLGEDWIKKGEAVQKVASLF